MPFDSVPIPPIPKRWARVLLCLFMTWMLVWSVIYIFHVLFLLLLVLGIMRDYRSVWVYHQKATSIHLRKLNDWRRYINLLGSNTVGHLPLRWLSPWLSPFISGYWHPMWACVCFATSNLLMVNLQELYRYNCVCQQPGSGEVWYSFPYQLLLISFRIAWAFLILN